MLFAEKRGKKACIFTLGRNRYISALRNKKIFCFNIAVNVAVVVYQVVGALQICAIKRIFAVKRNKRLAVCLFGVTQEDDPEEEVI